MRLIPIQQWVGQAVQEGKEAWHPETYSTWPWVTEDKDLGECLSHSASSELQCRMCLFVGKKEHNVSITPIQTLGMEHPPKNP